MTTTTRPCEWGTCDGSAAVGVPYPDGSTLWCCEACAPVARDEAAHLAGDQAPVCHAGVTNPDPADYMDGGPSMGYEPGKEAHDGH